MLSEFVSPETDAQVVVLFGKNERKRDEVIRQLMVLERLSVFGTLSLEEGLQKISSIPKTDLIVIGGMYPEGERKIIRNWRDKNFPKIIITEPGTDYPYKNGLILKKIKELLGRF